MLRFRKKNINTKSGLKKKLLLIEKVCTHNGIDRHHMV